jgi:hypothetical protein
LRLVLRLALQPVLPLVSVPVSALAWPWSLLSADYNQKSGPSSPWAQPEPYQNAAFAALMAPLSDE